MKNSTLIKISLASLFNFSMFSFISSSLLQLVFFTLLSNVLEVFKPTAALLEITFLVLSFDLVFVSSIINNGLLLFKLFLTLSTCIL